MTPALLRKTLPATGAAIGGLSVGLTSDVMADQVAGGHVLLTALAWAFGLWGLARVGRCIVVEINACRASNSKQRVRERLERAIGHSIDTQPLPPLTQLCDEFRRLDASPPAAPDPPPDPAISRKPDPEPGAETR